MSDEALACPGGCGAPLSPHDVRGFLMSLQQPGQPPEDAARAVAVVPGALCPAAATSNMAADDALLMPAAAAAAAKAAAVLVKYNAARAEVDAVTAERDRRVGSAATDAATGSNPARVVSELASVLRREVRKHEIGKQSADFLVRLRLALPLFRFQQASHHADEVHCFSITPCVWWCTCVCSWSISTPCAPTAWRPTCAAAPAARPLSRKTAAATT